MNIVVETDHIPIKSLILNGFGRVICKGRFSSILNIVNKGFSELLSLKPAIGCYTPTKR